MADVFMAVPKGQNRLVAVKVMARAQFDKPEYPAAACAQSPGFHLLVSHCLVFVVWQLMMMPSLNSVIASL